MRLSWTKHYPAVPRTGSGPRLAKYCLALGPVLAMEAATAVVVAHIARNNEPMEWWNIRAGMLFLSWFAVPLGILCGVLCAPAVSWSLFRKRRIPAIFIAFGPAIVAAPIFGALYGALSAPLTAVVLIGSAFVGRFMLSNDLWIGSTSCPQTHNRYSCQDES